MYGTHDPLTDDIKLVAKRRLWKTVTPWTGTRKSLHGFEV
jgi:hypothetical protein